MGGMFDLIHLTMQNHIVKQYFDRNQCGYLFYGGLLALWETFQNIFNEFFFSFQYIKDSPWQRI